MLGSMTRRVHGFDLDVANHKRIAIGKAHVIELILPICAPFIGEVHHGTRHIGELARAAEEVGMDMRFCKVRDAQAFLTSDIDIGVDVALRIDDQAFAGLLAADHVGCVGEARFVDLLEKHMTSFQFYAVEKYANLRHAMYSRS